MKKEILERNNITSFREDASKKEEIKGLDLKRDELTYEEMKYIVKKNKYFEDDLEEFINEKID